LPQIFKEISETATRISASYKVKIVAIDDGSVDESWNVLKSSCCNDGRVEALQ
jgi:hypothetical protein